MALSDQTFCQGLSSIELNYWQAFLDLFARVDARCPEKGARSLIMRARHQAALVGGGESALVEALAKELAAATARTERRLALLGACRVDGVG